MMAWNFLGGSGRGERRSAVEFQRELAVAFTGTVFLLNALEIMEVGGTFFVV